jgi:murein DD-endopeptidase MepM/ murein hydrolase activator NlpD
MTKNSLAIVTMLLFSFLATVFPATSAKAGSPSFLDPGDLIPGTGQGVKDATILYPDIRFPIEQAPAYANSQVNNPGGSKPGDQCSKSNYDYPWRDDFCETRQWKVGVCPKGVGHQGQDIRPAKCKKDFYWAVAVDDGVISQVGKYSVTLLTSNGTAFRYLHLQMDELAVHQLQKVHKGDQIGKVSNYFGGAPTTIHLHFDIHDTIVFKGKSYSGYVPPYTSLVAAYKRLLGNQ